MKKISLTVIVSLLAIATQAQDHENFEPFKDREFLFDILHIGTMLIAIYIISSFILQIFKAGMTARIKNRILDKGTQENIVKEILQPDKKENKNYILQWFFIMLAIGVAFLLLMITSPFGLHSLAIIAFSIAAGFGAYYYFTRQNGDR
jgi:NADH:ubiquinone oxidoreductase subunit 3 (subunit A)